MTTHPLGVWLKETGTTQAALAEKVGTKQPRISDFLSGKDSFGPALAARIRAITGVSLDDLLLNTPAAEKRRVDPDGEPFPPPALNPSAASAAVERPTGADPLASPQELKQAQGGDDHAA